MKQEESYLTAYFKLIRAALSEDRKKGGATLYEAHHIVPKSFKKASTLVLLTPREHYAAHWYLMKHFDNHHTYGEKMMWAFHAMTYCKGKWLTASEYQTAREALMPLWQRPKSPEHKRAIGQAHTKKRYVVHPETGEMKCIDMDELEAFMDAGWENTNKHKGKFVKQSTRDKLAAAGRQRLQGKTGLQAQAAKGPYSVIYEDGKVVTAGSYPQLSDLTGIKVPTLYYRMTQQKGKYIGGYTVVKGDATTLLPTG